MTAKQDLRFREGVERIVASLEPGELLSARQEAADELTRLGDKTRHRDCMAMREAIAAIDRRLETS